MAQVPYDSTNKVAPEVSTGGDYLTVRASPASMGEAVGDATQGFGQQLGKTSAQFGEMADQAAKQVTEAKANDVIANQFAPAAAQLRAGFYQKQGMDAVQGQDAYVASLNSLRGQTLGEAKSPYEKEILGHWMAQHVAQEVDGAARHADDQLTKFEDGAHTAMLSTLSATAVNNYNNPDLVDKTIEQGKAFIQKHAIDRGLTGPDGQAQIDQQERKFVGDNAKDMVGRALASGDVTTAKSIYAKYHESIPGPEQLQIDSMMHSQNMRQYGMYGAQALLNGQPLPQTYGPPTATAARAATVDAAQSSGVDPNHALAVLRIESADGQNVGKRGDIGQTGKGGDLPEQAKNMVTELARVKPLADTATGGTSEPWQQYVVYQQGEGGGPALIKASLSGSTARAVDVLAPLYKNPKDATSAIVNNGGNATMTASQFLDFIHAKYDASYQRAKMSFPGQAQNQSLPNETPPQDQPGDQTAPAPTDQSKPADSPAALSEAVLKPHQETGVAMQPGSTPRQALLEFDKVYSGALQRANQIPNDDQREAVIKGLNEQRMIYQNASTAYTTGLIDQAAKLSVSPQFTDMNQVPPDMYNALATDSPQTIHMLQARAEYNASNGASGASKDMKEYGQGFSRVQNDVWDNKITNVSQLHDAYNRGDLTYAGLKVMTEELTKPKDPEGQGETKLKEQSYKAVRQMFLAKADKFDVKDPDGELAYGHAMALMQRAEADGIKNGIPKSELFDTASKNWVGNVAKPLVKTLDEKQASIDAHLNGKPSGAPAMEDRIIDKIYNSPNGPMKWTGTGWMRVNAPSVPTGE